MYVRLNIIILKKLYCYFFIGDIGYNNNFEINKSICQSDGKWSEIKFQCTSKYLFYSPL